MSAPVDVLVVEDDESVRELWIRTLCEAGYRVGAAASFKEARAAVTERSPRVLVTDIRLGEYNGLQLVALVQATERRIAMLVVTGFDDHVLELEARRLGARFALKPLSPERLVETVAEILRQSAAV